MGEGGKWKNHGNSRGCGSTVKPPGTENPGGWGVNLEKPSVGGMDIFWNHTLYLNKIITFLFTFCFFKFQSISFNNKQVLVLNNALFPP